MLTSVRVRGFEFRPGSPIQAVEALDYLQKEYGDKRFVWMDIEGELHPEDEAFLAARLDWHPLVFQNIRLPSSRPRLTPFEDYSHLTVHALPPDAVHDRSRRAVEMDLVFCSHYLISFHREGMPIVDQVMQDVQLSRVPPKSPDLLLHKLLTSAVEAIAPAVDRMDDALNVLEEEALLHAGKDLLERIVLARDELFLLHLSLAPQLQLLHDLTSGAGRFVTPYARPFFKSLENRLRGLIDDVAIYKEVAQNTLDLYRSAITHKTNEVIRVLTVVSTPLLVLSFLTGLYGMNVPLPFSEHDHVFTWMVGIGVALFFGMMWWFQKRDWF